MVSFAELPDDVLETVISFLPQQSKVNLAYTEYKFYALVLPKLYQNILIRYSMPLEPPQKSSEATQAPATGVFLSSTATVIGGSTNDLYSKKQKLEFLKLRQEVLLQSLTINESLLSYIESFTVIDDINDQEDDEEHLFEGEVFDIDLIKLIKKNCQNLQKYNIFCQISELNLADDELETKVNLQSLTLTNLNQLCIVSECCPNIKEIILNLDKGFNQTDIKKIDKRKVVSVMSKLDSLILSYDEFQSYFFVRFLLSCLESTFTSTPQKKFDLKRLRMVNYHGFNNVNIECQDSLLEFFFSRVNFSALKQLEMVVGCDELVCNCLLERFFDPLEALQHDKKRGPLALEKLSIVQKTIHKDHNYTEKFDFLVTNFITASSDMFVDSLKFLAVTHSPPIDGNILNETDQKNDLLITGFEGNYIKRKRMWYRVLPALHGVETLVMPNFIQSCSCYEQVMSDMLWNGCKCPHCTDYLPLFDKFIMGHKYYNKNNGRHLDILTTNFFAISSFKLSSRLIPTRALVTGLTEFGASELPPNRVTFNFHDAIGITERTDDERVIDLDKECSFNQSAFRPLVKCLSHFVESNFLPDFLARMPQAKMLVFNGIFYTRSHENPNRFSSLFD